MTLEEFPISPYDAYKTGFKSGERKKEEELMKVIEQLKQKIAELEERNEGSSIK